MDPPGIEPGTPVFLLVYLSQKGKVNFLDPPSNSVKVPREFGFRVEGRLIVKGTAFPYGCKTGILPLDYGPKRYTISFLGIQLFFGHDSF